MNTEIWDIIARSFAGEATSEEKAHLDTWKASAPENVHLFEEAEQVWKASGEVPFDFQPDVEAAWNKMSARIDAEEKEETPVVPITKKMHNDSRWFIGIAAAMIVLLAAFMYLKFAVNETGDGFAQSVVAENETKEVTLPDGTKVTLNKHSSLYYPSAFNASERLVKLHGEAFFDVTKNADQPFVIITTKTRTEVVGTSFNLRSFPGKKRHELVVHSGKVAFTGYGAAGIFLEAGEQGTFQIYGTTQPTFEMIKTKKTTPNDLSWKTGLLEFNNTPLRDLAYDLEDHFGIEIKIDPSVPSNADWTGDYESATLEEVLNDIETGTELTFKVEGTQVTVSKAGS